TSCHLSSFPSRRSSDLRKRRLSILCFTLMLCGLILHAPALAEDEIVIVFRQQAAHGGQWVQNAIERFEAKNPGVRVVERQSRSRSEEHTSELQSRENLV